MQKLFKSKSPRKCHIWSTSSSIRMPNAWILGFRFWLRMHIEHIPLAWECFLFIFFLFHLLFRRKDCRLATIWHRVQTNIHRHKAMSLVTSGVHWITYIHISFSKISHIFNGTPVIWSHLCMFGIHSIIETLLKLYFIALRQNRRISEEEMAHDCHKNKNTSNQN